MIKEAIPLRDCVAGVPAIELVRAALEDVLPSPAASQAQAAIMPDTARHRPSTTRPPTPSRMVRASFGSEA
jgi:hypothetical protein